MASPPVLDFDPFSEAFQHDPERFYEPVREAGPVVFLERLEVWALARFAEVRAALRDPERFCSSAGVGVANFWKEEPWRPPSLLLEADPPAHTSVRRITSRVLSPRTIEALRGDFERQAGELVTEVAVRGEFDGVTDLAQAYLLRVFSDAVGLSPQGRENLLGYGNMVFNGFGPRNQLFEEAMAVGAPVRDWIAGQCQRGTLAPDGLGARMYTAVDRDEITEEEAGLLVRSLLSAGIDTTLQGLAWSLHLLAAKPDRWAMLRDNPTLARSAFEETLRYASPVQMFFRTTTGRVRVADAVIPAGEKVLCLLAAANRDPRQWPEPDRFDPRRTASEHLAFGSGIHACVGAAIARFEAEILLTALARHVRTLEPAGPPRLRPNNILRALSHLPLRARTV